MLLQISQLTPEQGTALQVSSVLLNAAVIPVLLSEDLSINLAKVAHYGAWERTKTVTQGEGKNAVEAEEGTGEFDPCLFFEGTEEPLILTPEQNEIFRPVWNDYATIAQIPITAAHEVAAAINTQLDVAAGQGGPA